MTVNGSESENQLTPQPRRKFSWILPLVLALATFALLALQPDPGIQTVMVACAVLFLVIAIVQFIRFRRRR